MLSRLNEIAQLVNKLDYLETLKQNHIDSIVSLNETIEQIQKELTIIEEDR